MKLKIIGPVRPRGETRVNGDKSITHRALLISSLARGTSTIRDHTLGQDCSATRRSLSQLGIRISEEDSVMTVEGRGIFGYAEPPDVVDCQNSGTTMRMLAGLLAGQPFFSVLNGDASLRSRPMDRVIKPLSAMGAAIKGRACDRFAPLCIAGRKLNALEYAAPVASAQVKSAVLIAGLHACGETTFEEPIPTRDHTERMLDYFGVPLRRSGRRISISPVGAIAGREITVPGDISSAAFLIIWSVIVPGGDLCVRGVGVNRLRAGVIGALATMGAHVNITNSRSFCNEPVADLVVKPSMIRGTEISGELIPRLIDELPVLAVAATQAEGITTVRDAGELRVKECDRIKAIVSGLERMGARIRELDQGFTVEGPVRLRGAEVDSCGDHRIAMSLAIAALAAEGETVINGCECIAVSFPEFTRIINGLGNNAVRIE